jgi:hypothetical protein
MNAISHNVLYKNVFPEQILNHYVILVMNHSNIYLSRIFVKVIIKISLIKMFCNVKMTVTQSKIVSLTNVNF